MNRSFAAATIAALPILLAPAMAEEVWITIDQAEVHSVDRPLGSVVVGNPAIADVAVRSTTELMLFGKMPGVTNIYFFDQQGEPVSNLQVRVQSPQGRMITLQSGENRYTYSCTSVCEQTLAIGDGSNASRANTATLLEQVERRYELAVQASSGTASTSSVRPETDDSTDGGDDVGTPEG